MAEPRLKRPFQERFLDGFDRTRLNEEVEAVKPRRGRGLRKKYATWALGASLALGGIGAPLKMIQHPRGSGEKESTQTMTPATGIERDLDTAKKIAEQVAGGVEAAVGGVAPLDVVAEAPRKLAVITDQVREQFFKSEVPFGSIRIAWKGSWRRPADRF